MKTLVFLVMVISHQNGLDLYETGRSYSNMDACESKISKTIRKESKKLPANHTIRVSCEEREVKQ